MNITAIRITAAREALGISQSELARELGISPQSVQAWESGKNTPRPKRLSSLSSVLCRSVSYLMGEDGGDDESTDNVSAKVGVGIKEGLVPVVGKAQLGVDGFFEALDYPVGHGDGYIQLFSDDPNAYALKVVGDSMQPRIRSGEYVLIEPNKPFMSGDEVLVKTHCGRAMIKQLMYRRDGEVRLLSVNDAHPPITLLETEIEKIHFVGAIVKASRFVQF